jgi:hypothetical protein
VAAKSKEFPLSITIRTVDRASSGIQRINEKLERSFGPFKRLRTELGNLHENMGLPKIAAGFRGISSMAKDAAKAVGLVAAAGVGAAFAVKGLVDEYDQLGARAARLGMSVDGLASLQFAAEKSDVEVEELNSALGTFNKGIGQAKAGTGRFAGFLKRVSPELLRQVKAAKSNEEALGLMADAMVKLDDPTKRAALAAAAFGGSGEAMIPLLGRGRAGVADLQAEFLKHAGSQQAAADAAGNVDDAMKNVSASMKGVKAAIMVGLGPALADLAARASSFLSENREQLAAWARDFGEKLPARIAALGEFLRRVKDDAIMPIVRAIGWIVDKLGGAENAVKVLIAAFVAFKGLQLVGHLGQVAQGLIGVATAATAATRAAAGGGAAGAAGAAGGGAGAAAGGAGLISRIAAPAAVAYGVAKSAAWAIDADQESKMAAKDRGFSVLQDLKRFKSDQSAARQRMLYQSLATGGFLDPKTGQFLDTFQNRQALSAYDKADPMGDGGAGKAEALATFAAAMRPTLGAEFMARQSKAEAAINIKFENAPANLRVTTDPASTADVTTDVGYQMGAAP